MTKADKPKLQPQVVAGRFRNPPGAPQPTCGPRGFAGFIWRRLRDRQVPVPPAGHVLDKQAVLDGLGSHADQDSLTWLGHAAFLIQLGGTRLLTDPFLSGVAAPWPARQPKRYVPAALGVDELPAIDLILISHNHYDHLDAPTIKRLRDKADTPVVVPLGLAAFFRKRGFSQVQELGWWDNCRIGELKITVVPAIHFSRRGPWDANKSLWCGYVVEAASGHKLYFAGDTAYHPVFADIGAEFGPIDTALVPIGAYAPRGIMAGAHVNPEEAAALCRDVGARHAVAMHWGTLVLTDEPAFEPPARFRQAMQKIGQPSPQIPAIGQTLPLTADVANKNSAA